MKFTICSSAKDTIDNKYKESAKHLLEYLVSLDDAQLLWGAADTSIMGLCYDEFRNANKKIYGYTNKKYEYMLDNLTYSENKVLDTTFDLKKAMFQESDVIIYLYGGVGTISEFFAHLEESRSNDDSKRLIIYDEFNYFGEALKSIDKTVLEKFGDSEIYKYYHVAHNLEEFKTILKGE